MHFKAEFINSDTPVKKLIKHMKQNKCAQFLIFYDHMIIDHNHILCSTMGIKYQNNWQCIFPDMFKSIIEWCAD